MNKRFIISVVAIIGLVALFFAGCKKNNHDTLVALGDEHYMKTIDSVYPKKYRDVWHTIKPTASVNDPTYDKVYEGIFPPDITGEYLMQGIFVNGNDSTIENSGIHKPVPYNQYPPQQTVQLKVLSQKNGIAKLKYIEQYPGMIIPSEYDVDTAYVFGYKDGTDDYFTLVFDLHDESYGQDNHLGILISGKHTEDGIYGINKWKLFKSGSSNYVEGGQHYYYDDFAENDE